MPLKKNTAKKRLSGASGSIFGLGVSNLLLNPTQKAFGIPTWPFSLFYILIVPLITEKNLQIEVTHIPHIPHLGGSLFGIFFTFIFKPSLLKEIYNYATQLSS